MKTKKVITILTAAVMSVASMPVFSASAAEAVPGDVDKDGVITGHDTAIVSRSLYDDTFELTEEQAVLADMNGDGTVTQEDLEAIHVKEERAIGAFYGKYAPKIPVNISDAHGILVLSSLVSVGCEVELDENAEFLTSREMYQITSGDVTKITLNPVQYNLADANANGKIELNDAILTLFAHSHYMVGHSLYAVEGRYEFLPETYR